MVLDFWMNGIHYYNDGMGMSVYGTNIIGDLIIPETVTYNGNSYNIVKIFSISSQDITSVAIPSTVWDIQPDAFDACSNLKNINVSDNNSYYSSINGVLFNKSKSILIRYSRGREDSIYTIPNSVTNIGSSAFSSCINLENIIMSDSVKTISSNTNGGAFYNCIKLTNIIFSNNLTDIGQNAFSYCSSLTNIIIPNSVINIWETAFMWTTNLKNLIIPSNVQYLSYQQLTCLWIRVDCQESVFLLKQNNYERYKVVKNNYIYYLLNGHTADEIIDSTINTTPTTPPSITHNAIVSKTLNDQVVVTWGASTDVNNDPITYDLYFFDGKTWVAIKGNSSELTFTHSIPITSYNTTQAKYKVRAFDGSLYSDFIESSTFEIYGATNSPPTISGEDSDLGSLTDAPTNITYSVNDINDKDTLNVSIEINNDLIDFIGDVTRNQDYTVDLTNIWDSLEYNTEYTLTVSVTDGKDTAERQYTFSRYQKINYLPTISGIDTNLGRQDFTFNQTCSVDDEDDSVDLTVTVKVDNTILNTISNAIRNQTYTIDLSSIWDSLAVKEPHKITITVSDENSNTATRIYNFFKGNGDNYAPIIDGTDSNLGEKNKPFNQSFIINDSNSSDNIQVVIYLDGNIIDQTYNATRGFEYNISINSDLFNKLENNSNHTIQIVASDGIAITTRNYIFTKKDILEDYITLDVRFEYILPIIECKQDDDLTLKFKIENLDEDIDLTDYTIKFKALKYDGSIYESTDITKTNTGIVTVNCNKNLTNIIGRTQCQVQIFDMNNNQYNTQLFDLFIRRNCIE